MAVDQATQAAGSPYYVERAVPGGPTATGIAVRALLWLLLAACLYFIPAHSDGLAYDATQGVVFAMVGLSMNLLVGYTGQLSLGHQGFVGLGALAAANLTASGLNAAEPLSFAFGLTCAVLLSASLAIALGAVALRVTGLYLALLTLVFGAAVTSSILGISSLNGHDVGVKANRPNFVGSSLSFYVFCAALLAIVFYLDRRLMASKAGRAMLATKENERAAEAFGINVVATKLLAFALSGAIAGLAGGLGVFLPQTFSQKDYVGPIGFNLALTFVVVAVVGGLGNRLGVLVASVFFGILDPLLAWIFRVFGGSGYYVDHKGYLPGLIGAFLLLDTVVRRPGGLGQLISPFSRWMTGRPFTFHDPNSASGSEVAADVRA